MERITVTAGGRGTDFPGFTNVTLQAAVDRAASLGGGCVILSEGVYRMRDSLHLRNCVEIRGQGDLTVLKKEPCKGSATLWYLGYGHYDVSVAHPENFEIGDGVYITDCEAGGFYATQSTVTYKDGSTLGIAHPLNHDIGCSRHGSVRTLFPLVKGEFVSDVTVSDLKLDGSAAENERIDGCRGGGVFTVGGARLTFRNLTVTDYHGDGISFQQGRDIRVLSCRCIGNRGHGLHPGSGSVNVLIDHCDFSGNGGDGTFFCLRVDRALFRNNRICGNARAGVSIGHRDFHIGIVDCSFSDNHDCGILFRNANLPYMSGAYTYIFGCTFSDLCENAPHTEIHIPLALTSPEIGSCTFSSPFIPVYTSAKPDGGHLYNCTQNGAPYTNEDFSPTAPAAPFRVNFAETPSDAFAHLPR